MKQLLFFILLLVVRYATAQNIPIPKEYEIIEKVSGDLDKDSIAELVVILNTDKSDDFSGKFREIQIFKLTNKEWVLWKKSSDAIMQSTDGGMMGDPYVGTEIKNGILLISHYGGSSWKWGNTDKYRFQNNEFVLIGHSCNFGRLCEYFEYFDFNLSTGKIEYKKEYERCDEKPEGEEQVFTKTDTETFIKKGILINLSNRHTKKFEIVSPKYKVTLYL